METQSDTPFGHVDLFCGPGGFATGFDWAGFRSLLGIDIHVPSIDTYRRNHPASATILGDIRGISTTAIRAAIGSEEVHIITAGVPCEGFSMANRNRTKFVDERNFLFLEFLRIVRDLHPPYIVLENVSALTHHSDGFFKDEIERGMVDLGYRVERQVLDALSYGVPQRRRRVFFVGRLEGWSFEWPAPTHGLLPGLLPSVTVGEAILDLPPLASGECTNEYLPITGRESPYALRMRGGSDSLHNHVAPKHPAETIARIAATPPGAPMYPRFRQRIRLHPDRPCPTLVSGGIRPQFHYGHPTQPRGMTVRERARIQSFPDAYFFEGGVVQGRVQTGDAVPPLLAHAIGVQIVRGLRAGAGAPSDRIERQESLRLF